MTVIFGAHVILNPVAFRTDHPDDALVAKVRVAVREELHAFHDEIRSVPVVPPPLMTAREVAAVLRVSERTVRRRVARGELAAVFPLSGRGWRVHPEALKAYVRASSRVRRA